MKVMFLDVETTGTDPAKHALVQVAGRFYCDRGLVEEFNLLMCPPGDAEIEDDALKIQGRTREQIQAFADWSEQKVAFEAMLEQHVERFNKNDKVHFIAYNATFDDNFMRAWFKRCNDDYYGSWFWWPPIDVSQLCGLRLMRERHQLENFKLMTVAKYLGVQVDDGEAHDAMHDITVTMRLFRQVRKDLGVKLL